MLSKLFLVVVLTLVTPTAPTPYHLEARSGFAAHYNVGLMERVSDNRKLPRVGCMISNDHHPIGSWVIVVSHKYEHALLCRVTDVSAPRDRARHIRQRLIAELDFPSAKILCNIHRVGEQPWRMCPVDVIGLPDVSDDERQALFDAFENTLHFSSSEAAKITP